MNFITVRGTQEEKPRIYECCGNAVFVRKNIRRVTVESMGEEVEMWEYEEAKISVQEFTENFAASTEDTIEQNAADIAYIAMMADIDL